MAFSTPVIRILLLVACYFSLSARPAAAQRRYARSVVPGALNTLDEAKAADQDLSTAATLQPNLTQAGAAERVQFPSVIAAGSGSTGLSMRVNGVSNLAMASVLGGITIKSYLNGVLRNTWQASRLLNVTLFDPGQQNDIVLSPAPTSDFDQLELSAASAVSAYTVSFFEAFGPSPAPLPVQLVSFAGQASGAGAVQLSWQTASEVNSRVFVVERVATAQAEFVPLGEVAAAGSSAQARRYQFLDANAPAGTSYYRLRQLDTDGQAHYSPVVAVPVGSGPTLAAYPSPAAATLMVACPVPTQVAILDLGGRLVQQATLAAGPQLLDVSQLPAGIYYLRAAATGQHVRFEKAP